MCVLSLPQLRHCKRRSCVCAYIFFVLILAACYLILDHNHTKIETVKTLRIPIALHNIKKSIDKVNLLPVNEVVESEEVSVRKFGYNSELSKRISLERTLPDARHERCHNISYDLPVINASVIIVYYNEQRAVLLRTLHSVWRLTPPPLLHELIVVDDYSDPAILGMEFDEELMQHFPTTKVRLLHASKRLGLIQARVWGARQANGSVLVFLDAHVEVTEGWLPPLLEPIATDVNTCTTPIIDTIRYDTFEYVAATPARGGFNWQFNYVQLPLRPKERDLLPAPHENPVMNGGLFAIDAKFFWRLGAYDEQLRFWGAEQFELSFKIWMCGGRLLEVPCSRVGHLYRAPEFRVSYSNTKQDFIARNYKRVAEVWLDEYRYALYEHVPKLSVIRAGDVTARKTLRRQLKCKSFKWFMERIAPDFLRTYPPLEPSDYANGALQSLAAPQFCLDATNSEARQPLGELRSCSPVLKYPYAQQRWHLSYRRDLRHQGNCLEVQSWQSDAPVWLWPCHNQGGNQFWYYDRQTHMLVHGDLSGTMERRCLEFNIALRRLQVNECDFAKATMRWRFGYVNETAMDAFHHDLNTERPLSDVRL